MPSRLASSSNATNELKAVVCEPVPSRMVTVSAGLRLTCMCSSPVGGGAGQPLPALVFSRAPGRPLQKISQITENLRDSPPQLL